MPAALGLEVNRVNGGNSGVNTQHVERVLSSGREPVCVGESQSDSPAFTTETNPHTAHRSRCIKRHIELRLFPLLFEVLKDSLHRIIETSYELYNRNNYN